MTRDQWKAAHRWARQRRPMHMAGFHLMRDDYGRLGVTKRHNLGHLIAPAAIANILGYAAAWRHVRTDHAYYIEKVRLLRKKGTWMG